ncbi:MAG: hypothetical protein OEV74_08105 [Cyclobacteriaceae bacterium]|nr:hypothetical protein [Cyclobacteriaceae bacterium]MDH4296224.1 hypothetical protein [Cyclobacteriaceae bacterium]MDH5251583.1 hypothetical protein [Cyclobacteriaceae bacterium]
MNYITIQLGFVATTFIVYFLLFTQFQKGLKKSNFPLDKKKRIYRNTLIVLIVWTVLISTLSLSGLLSDFSTLPPRQLIVLAVPLVCIPWAISTKTAKEIFKHIPAYRLIYLQSFRIIVEILLWMLFLESLVPVQMTFEGRNFDVLSGLSAPIVGYFVHQQRISKLFCVAWNLVCLGLLLNIVTTAILSMPTPLRAFMNEPANTIVAKFPIVWLPGLLVPMAYGLHLASLRQLLTKK